MWFFLDQAWWAWNGWTAVAALAQAFAAVAGVLAVGAAIYIAGVLAPREAEKAARAAEDRQRHREAESEGRRFRVAALLVYDELRANLSILEIAQKAGELPQPLAFQTYSQHQLLLAEHLDHDSRDSVRAAYVYAQVPRVFAQRVPMVQSNAGHLSMADTFTPLDEHIEAARKKTARAIAVLGWQAQTLPGGYKDL